MYNFFSTDDMSGGGRRRMFMKEVKLFSLTSFKIILLFLPGATFL